MSDVLLSLNKEGVIILVVILVVLIEETLDSGYNEVRGGFSIGEGVSLKKDV